MSYLGRATDIKFETKLNGTHTLTFQLPDRYFDSEKGEYVRNEFVDNLFNERKIKLYFLGEWYEFYIKSVSDSKQFKSYMKKYNCTDAFIDELSRNGYGITFDTELYNNVEEIGTFSRVILEDSIWSYAPEYNWGDFTEYLEEKLFKIPVGGDLFPTLVGHKLYYNIDEPRNGEQIINAFTHKKRGLEMGDDLAAAVDGKGGYFWDDYDGSMPLMSKMTEEIPNDGYIYVPYSQLGFCYKTTSTDINAQKVLVATEEVCYYDEKSYAIAPQTVDPTALIQFIAIPKGVEIEVDEAGLIVNKNYTYVMTVEEWNSNINSAYYYKLLPESRTDGKEFKKVSDMPDGFDYKAAAVGNLAAYYDGYLDKIGDLEVIYGKKISISDRTEVNITDEINQYVTVYNQAYNDTNLIDLYVNPDELWKDVDGIQYRVCSKSETRQIVPQLSRNYLQNGTKIKSIDGWEPQRIYDGEAAGGDTQSMYKYSAMQLKVNTWSDSSDQDYITNPKDTFLQVSPPVTNTRWSTSEVDEDDTWKYEYDYYNDFPGRNNHDQNYVYNTLLNFGIVGQEKELNNDKIYCLGFKIGLEVPPDPPVELNYSDNENRIKNRKDAAINELMLIIGEGSVLNTGNYNIDYYRIDTEDEDDTGPNRGISIPLRLIVSKDSLQEITIQEKSPSGKETIEKQIYVFEGYIFLKINNNIKNPYFGIQNKRYNLTEYGTKKNDTSGDVYKIWYKYSPNYYIFNAYLFEAYTKGRDQFDGNNIKYRYSGREFFDTVLTKTDENNMYRYSDIMDNISIHNQVIFEDDIMPGDTYEYQHYFIQQVAAYESDYETGQRTGKVAVSDTFAQKELLSNYADLIAFKNTNISHHDLPYSAAQFTNDDLEVSTKYIDLNKCKYYKENVSFDEPDCSFNGKHICLYQKYGYCPYLFETEKHCRKIRTLSGEKSNRFNLTQELSKVFEIYPIYWTEHYENGKIKTEKITDIDENGNSITYDRMNKKLFYIKEKGMENKLGFRYEKNLSSISRDIKSDQIVTKLYVSDVDSELSKTGLCSIKTAEDNPSKDSFIINFNYYTTKGILDKIKTDADLYGVDKQDIGYLKQLGHLNTEYDKISNSIINLEIASFNELEANVQTNTTAIETAQKQLYKIKKDIDRYKSQPKDSSAAEQAAAEKANKENQSYQNQITKYNEQLNILNNLIFETFFDQNNYHYLRIEDEGNLNPPSNCSRDDVMSFFNAKDITWMKDSSWFKQHMYCFGMLGQYNREYLQIQEWKKQQANLLKEINKLTLKFFRKYEPYLKEGTWSDSNYISDNAYYFGAVEVAAEGSIPKVSYNINVVDLYALPEYEDYCFNIADTTYVEDIGMFGINNITGLPNRLKVIISGITYSLDEPAKNTINVQNFTTQFADLFQQVTASVQSLSFNENIYKRASNFTSNQNIDQDSLQGTLDTNEMQLIKTDETNIEIDKEGQSGSDMNNHTNKYKLNGQGMFFSNNGGETWNIGVGPGGINADYIKVGTLDAGKIRIVDNDYLYFLWDKNGISAFRDPQSASGDIKFNDYALFNRYGLSLVEKGKIRLRAGYNYNGQSGTDSAAGDVITEETQGEDIGFYLYNNKGQAIFYSAVKSNDAASDANSAKVYLVGEMYVTDKIGESTPTGTDYKYTGGYKITEEQTEIYTDKSTISISINDTALISSQSDLQYTRIDINGTFNDKNNAYIYLTNPPNYDSTKDNIYTLVFLQSSDQINVKVSKNNANQYGLIDIGGIKHLVSQNGQRVVIEKISIAKDNNNVYSYTIQKTEDEVNMFEHNNITYIKDGKYNSQNTIKILTEYNDIATGYGGNVNIDTIDYFDKRTSSNDIVAITKNLYPLNASTFNYWDLKEENSSPSPSPTDVTSQIALYLNNTNIKNDGDIAQGTERILCIAGDINTGSSSQTRNFFSVRKDGAVYIGGTLETADGNPIPNAQQIPNEIKVVSPVLEVSTEHEGQERVYIDFNRFYNSVNGQNLYDSLVVAGGTVGQHRHTLNNAIATIDANNGIFNYLPDADASVTTILYHDSSTGMQETTVWDAIIHYLSNSNYNTVERKIAAFYSLLYDLMTKGYYEFDYGTTSAKPKLVFNNKVLGAGGEFNLTFINSTTGDVIGGGGTTQGYGLLDPGNADSGGGN